MSDRFSPGERVLVSQVDPSGHRRAPRYVRGHVVTVVAVHGRHVLPDDVVAHVTQPRVEPVYAVVFTADSLWGSGDHSVTVNLWESYLAPAEAGG
jgi:nitrile hydratase